MILIANIVTTSKALVARSDALVPSSKYVHSGEVSNALQTAHLIRVKHVVTDMDRLGEVHHTVPNVES